MAAAVQHRKIRRVAKPFMTVRQLAKLLQLSEEEIYRLASPERSSQEHRAAKKKAVHLDG